MYMSYIRGIIQLTLIGILVFLPSVVHAVTGNIPNSFGLHSSEIGTGNSSSLFTPEYSASYFNPAGLAQDNGFDFGLGYIYTRPQLTINNKIAFVQPNQILVVGIKLDLGKITTLCEILNKQITIGFTMGIDTNFKEILTITDKQSQSGQFIRYGRQPLLIASSIGFEIMKWLYIGGGAYYSITANAEVEAEANLAGETTKESVEMTASPKISPIAGILFRPGLLYDPLTGLDVALVYRHSSGYTLGVNADATATLGESTLTTIPLNMVFAVYYVPEQYSGAVKYNIPGYVEVFLELTYYRWEKLNEILKKKDALRKDLNIQFRNVYIPRFGVKHELGSWARMFRGTDIRCGYSFEPSPLVTTESLGVNLLDADKHVVSFGLGYTFKSMPGLKYPVSIDASYQLHMLQDRKFVLSQYDGTRQLVTVGGDLHSFAFSFTMKFQSPGDTDAKATSKSRGKPFDVRKVKE